MADLDARCEPLFSGLATGRGLLLAVSGGPDSLALLLLIDRWRVGRSVPIAVATVDHGLRAEAAAEASAVAALCTARGLPHHRLVWNATPPHLVRSQERARDARYALLVQCASEINADTIVTAHHADDQAETILMRLTRGSGIAGLAGMAAVSERETMTLARPLLGVTKAELVAYCRASGVAFANDPSNSDPKYRRAALRSAGPALAREGLNNAALLRLGRRAGRAEEALCWALSRAEADLPVARHEGQTVVPAKNLAALPVEIALRLLARWLGERNGRQVTLRLDRLEMLEVRLRAAIEAGMPFATTLGGCVVVVRKGELRIAPAPPRRVPRTDARADRQANLQAPLRTPASGSHYPSSVALLGKAGSDA